MIDPRSLPSTVALEDVLRRGREEFDAGRVEGALRTFDAAIRIKPTYAPAWRAKGRALRVTGDSQAALDCYAEALRHEPEDEISWFGLALALHALGRREEEVAAYDELLRRNPRSVVAWTNKGVTLHEAGRYEEALACCDRLLALRPEIAAAWNNRGAALLRLRRLEEALVAIDEALALDPVFADAAANRRSVLAQLQREEPAPLPIDLPDPATLPPSVQATLMANLGLPAIEAFRRTPPDTHEGYVALGTALLDEGNPEAAAAAFERAMARGAGAAAGVGKLFALEALGHPALAAEAPRLLEAFRGVVRIAIEVARIRESSGDLDGAIATLGGIVELEPDLAWIWGWKGLLEIRAGRDGAARASFEEATAGDPQDADAWANLGATLHRLGAATLALAACDRALAADPDHPAAWNNRGVVLSSMRRMEDAEEAFRHAVNGGATTAALNRASLAESRGQYRVAFDRYAAVLAHTEDPDAVAGRRRTAGHLGAKARRRSRRRKTR